MTTTEDTELRERVRQRYAAAATAAASGPGEGPHSGPDTASGAGPAEGSDTRPDAGSGAAPGTGCCSPGCCGGSEGSGGSVGSVGAEVDRTFGAGLYGTDETSQLPPEAVAASLGCGNPLAVADLHAGERVLDLGSGGGIDVLLSARRVGPTGFVYGVDMTDEMLDLARANAAKAGADNVEFVKGTIEQVPLPDGAVDVVISNCVINLSVDKPAVLSEMFRLLAPGGRLGISDVVAEDHLSAADRAERGSYVGCIAGALSRSEYLDGLADAGFVDASVTFTHQAADGMHAAIIRAGKPATVTTAGAARTPAPARVSIAGA